MRALHSVILKSEESYSNKETINGKEYTVNVSIGDVASINRKAIVVVAPVGSNLSIDDEVIVHHNIMRENIHNNGTLSKGNFWIGNGYYQCPVSEIMLKRTGDGPWETLLNFVFIKPIKEDNVELFGGLVLASESHKGYKFQRATLHITNNKLKNVKIGDNIIFAPYSEHEFMIDGELLYKCEVEDILAKE